MQGRGGLCPLLPPCQVAGLACALGCGGWSRECWATLHLDLGSVPPGQPLLLRLTHSSRSARILSLCRGKRDPGTSPWLTWPQAASWSPGSQLLACYPVQALPPAWLPIPSPLHHLPNSTPAALEDSAEGTETGGRAGVAEEAPSPPLSFQPPACLRPNIEPECYI